MKKGAPSVEKAQEVILGQWFIIANEIVGFRFLSNFVSMGTRALNVE